VTFSNEYMEISHIREILTYEVLGASGITVGRATPIRVYFDIGDGKGPTFWGLHTMVEDPTDHIIKSLPGDKTPGLGHVYKPTISTWEKFVASDFTRHSVAKGVVTKASKKSAKKLQKLNFADIEGAISTLHDPTRLTNPALWRKKFEAVFDVLTFIKFLGAISVIGDWDQYGVMPHNYYLYNLNGQFKWLPWDFHLAFSCDNRITSIFKDEIGDEWPLISFLLEDPVYRSNYTTFVQWFVTSGPFVAKDLITRKNQLIALVTPYVMGLADPKYPSITYPPEVMPHTTMYDPSRFYGESARLDGYINQRVEIVQHELSMQAMGLA